MPQKTSTLSSSFPFGGLDESRSFEDQRRNTSVDLLNVLPFAKDDGRLRGGQRPGHLPWITGGSQYVSHWLFDESSGNALDSRGSSPLVETGGTISATSGILGGARSKVLANSRYLSPASSTPFKAAGSWTFACWVKFDSIASGTNPYAGVWRNINGERRWILSYEQSTGRFTAYVSNDGTAFVALAATTFGPAIAGVWYHTALWYDSVGQILGIMVNGVSDTVAHTTGVFGGGASVFTILGYNENPAGFNFGGAVDEGIFLSAVVPVSELAGLWSSGAPVAESEFTSSMVSSRVSGANPVQCLIPDQGTEVSRVAGDSTVLLGYNGSLYFHDYFALTSSNFQPGGVAVTLRGAVWGPDDHVYALYHDQSPATSAYKLSKIRKDHTLVWTRFVANPRQTTNSTYSNGMVCDGVYVYLYLRNFAGAVASTTLYDRHGVFRFRCSDGYCAGVSQADVSNNNEVWMCTTGYQRTISGIQIPAIVNASLPDQSGDIMAMSGGRLAFLTTDAFTWFPFATPSFAHPKDTTVSADLVVVDRTNGALLNVNSITLDDTLGLTSIPGLMSLCADDEGNFYGIVWAQEWNGDSPATYAIATTIFKANYDGDIVWKVFDYAPGGATYRTITYDPVNRRLFLLGADVYETQMAIGILNPQNGRIALSHGLLASDRRFGRVAIDGGIMVSNGIFLYVYYPDMLTNGTRTALLHSGIAFAPNTRIVQGPDDADSSRTNQMIAVSNGTISKISTSGITSITNGTSALDASKQRIFAANYGADVFFVDGTNMKYLDASANTIRAWTARVGRLPVGSTGSRPKGITQWDNRIVLFDMADDPESWWMSKRDDPFDWQYLTGVSTSEEAISAINTVFGRPPGVVTAMLPINSDLLVVGLEREIWAITGNPAGGGTFDAITRTTGIAPGQPYCIDPQFTLYFYGSRGGIYRVRLNDRVEKISSNKIERRLANLDPDSYLFSMVWDDDAIGVRVYITPKTGTAAGTHIFFDVRTESWYVGQFSDYLIDPHVVAIWDGDMSNDRAVLLGGKDGYIRRPSNTSKNDDGRTINSYVMLGPYKAKGSESVEMRQAKLTLSQSSDFVSVNFRKASEPGDAYVSSDFLTHSIGPYPNPNRVRDRISAGAIYVKIGNANNGQSWAMESMDMEIADISGTLQRIL